MTLQPWFLAIEIVLSKDPPSTMMISPAIPSTDFKHWPNWNDSFSVGMMIDRFGRGMAECMMDYSISKWQLCGLTLDVPSPL